jgi:ribosomal protein S18 acetylase RimI-like enzyme
MPSVLDNIIWETLSGPQAHFAVGTGGSRRYAPGFSPILGFEDQVHPDFESLSDFCGMGESFYTDGWSGDVPAGWRLDIESTMFKMVWNGGHPAESEVFDAVELGPEHAEQALELAILTNPGPFGLRTLELGDYYGYFEGDRLVAMAGERMMAGEFREISGVCTHPEFQGRGLAKKLMAKLIHRQVKRNQTPFLHVMSKNELARGLYRRMGFTEYLETVVRVMTKE